MKRSAFTMIELILVIVIIGILSAIAIPRFAATRDDAQIAKGRSDVAAIRSAIVSERQVRLLKGESNYISALHGANAGILFDGNDSTHQLLQYGITDENKNGHWHLSNGKYVFKVINTDVTFDYNSTNGTFNCSGTYCSDLTQ
jgi:general secretion pathway protein G